MGWCTETEATPPEYGMVWLNVCTSVEWGHSLDDHMFNPGEQEICSISTGKMGAYDPPDFTTNLFIVESKWMFVPNIKKLPQLFDFFKFYYNFNSLRSLSGRFMPHHCKVNLIWQIFNLLSKTTARADARMLSASPDLFACPDCRVGNTV